MKGAAAGEQEDFVIEMNRSIDEGTSAQQHAVKSAVLKRSTEVKHSSGGRVAAEAKNRPSPLVVRNSGGDGMDETP